MNDDFDWSDKAVELLRSLVAANYSRSHIADVMRKAGHHVTRNAVIGKLRRLGLSGPPRNTKPKKEPQPGSRKRFRIPRMTKPKIKPIANPIVDVKPEFRGEDVSHGVEYLQLQRHHCRAPLGGRGSDGLMLSCGKTKGLDSLGREMSYCPTHARLFFNHDPGRQRII